MQDAIENEDRRPPNFNPEKDVDPAPCCLTKPFTSIGIFSQKGLNLNGEETYL